MMEEYRDFMGIPAWAVKSLKTFGNTIVSNTLLDNRFKTGLNCMFGRDGYSIKVSESSAKFSVISVIRKRVM